MNWTHTRRKRLLLRVALALLIGAVLGGLSGPAAAQAATPSQPKGPFYPRTLPAERDSDLASVGGRSAAGEAIVVAGRILDREGKPVGGARVEIWQTNAHGRYHHEGDDSPAPWDPGFQGWGETRTGADGAYRFRTIKPVAYSGRTPHIHFAVTVPGRRSFYTQLYFADAPENSRDFLLRELSPADRARLTVILEPPPPAAGTPQTQRLAHFDIILP